MQFLSSIRLSQVGVYVIEPHLLLLDTNDKSKVIQIKDFIVSEAPGGRRPRRVL